MKFGYRGSLLSFGLWTFHKQVCSNTLLLYDSYFWFRKKKAKSTQIFFSFFVKYELNICGQTIDKQNMFFIPRCDNTCVMPLHHYTKKYMFHTIIPF